MNTKRMITSFTSVGGVVRVGDVAYFSPQTSSSSILNNELVRKGFFADAGAPLIKGKCGGRNGSSASGIIPHTTPEFPLMGFGYVLMQNSLLGEAVDVFNLERGMDIRHLSYLQCAINGDWNKPSLFGHKRYPHYADVAAVNNLILSNNRAELTRLAPSLGFGTDERGFTSLKNTSLTSAISHDALMVAGGDGIKLIDPKTLDEDENYPRLLTGKQWSFYRDQAVINEVILVDTILGKGLLGRILNLADKSYVARDAMEYLRVKYGYLPGMSLPEGDEIAEIIREDPEVCALWASTKVMGGELVITNHRRLARYLRLRAALFRNVYNGLESRAGELIVGQILGGSLYRSQKVTASQLFSETDSWIEGEISRHLGSQDFLRRYCGQKTDAAETDTLEAALALREQSESKGIISRVERFRTRTKCGTEDFLTVKDGKVGLFAHLYPDDTELIRSLFVPSKPFRIYSRSPESLGVPEERRASLLEELKVVPLVL